MKLINAKKISGNTYRIQADITDADMDAMENLSLYGVCVKKSDIEWYKTMQMKLSIIHRELSNIYKGANKMFKKQGKGKIQETFEIKKQEDDKKVKKGDKKHA